MWSMRFDTSSPEDGKREASASIGLASGFAATPRDCALAEPAAPAAKPAAAARCKNCRRLDRLEFIGSSRDYGLSEWSRKNFTIRSEVLGGYSWPPAWIQVITGFAVLAP